MVSNLSFEKEWNKKAKKIYKNAVNHGFWKDEAHLNIPNMLTTFETFQLLKS